MSEVSERNFNNFELGDNVYELADGLIPEIAGRLGFLVGEKPDSSHMHELVGMVGEKKVLRDNEPVTAIDLETVAELLERSVVQKPLDRSLWTPELKPRDMDLESGTTIITGAIANWQDRTAELVADSIEKGVIPPRTQIITGNRVMDRKTEITNPNVIGFRDENDRYPTETEYATDFVLPRISESGGYVSLTSYETESGAEIAANFTKDHSMLFQDGAPIVFARVANAGIQLATQFRGAVREYADPEFDADVKNPEAFVITDDFPIARMPEQIDDPVNYQSPYTGLRQVVLTAKMLHEAA